MADRVSTFEEVRNITSYERPKGTHGCKLVEIVPGLFTAHFDDIKAPDSFSHLNLHPPMGLVVNAGVAQKMCDTYPGYYGSEIDVLLVDLLDDPTPGDAKQFFLLVNSKIAETLDAGKSVIVHCLGSISRSAVFLIAYLMQSRSLSVVQATTMLKLVWDATWPNDSFVRQLLQFEVELRASQS